MEILVGLIALYVWVHSVIIIAPKMKGATQYEKAVLVAGIVAFVLYFLGTAGNY